jgi:spoIIIJ-associated protein
MKSAIGTGKTVEKAIEDALAQLKCTQDEVTVRVISEGGLFKKAEVELTRDNYAEAKIEEVKPVAVKPVAEVKPVETKPAPAKSEDKKQEQPKAPAIKVHAESATSTEEKKSAKAAPAVQKTEAKKSEPKKTTGKTGGNNKEAIESFLNGLLYFSQARSVKVEVSEEDAHYKACVSGETLSALIGSGGETMHAIETVLNIISAKNKEQNKRVMLDIGDYRKGKAERLQELADNAVKRVRESGQQFRMKPMNNRERRIVHAHLQTCKDIKTFSRGEEPNRCVIVALASEGKTQKEFVD